MRAALGGNGIARGHGEFAVAGGGVALGDEAHRDAGKVGPLQQACRHAARPLFYRDLAVDGALREIEADIDRELARRSVGAIAGKAQAALVQVGGQQAIAVQRPARVHAGKRRREMQRLDRQRLQVDADRQLERAAALPPSACLVFCGSGARTTSTSAADSISTRTRPSNSEANDQRSRAFSTVSHGPCSSRSSMRAACRSVGKKPLRPETCSVSSETRPASVRWPGGVCRKANSSPSSATTPPRTIASDAERAHQKACPRLT